VIARSGLFLEEKVCRNCIREMDKDCGFDGLLIGCERQNWTRTAVGDSLRVDFKLLRDRDCRYDSLLVDCKLQLDKDSCLGSMGSVKASLQASSHLRAQA
jgi:hypothetical protein